MVKKGKLKAALDSYKAKDYKLEHQKKLRKQAARLKRNATTEEADREPVDNDEGEGGVKLDEGTKSINSPNPGVSENALGHDSTDSDSEEAQQLVRHSPSDCKTTLTILKIDISQIDESDSEEEDEEEDTLGKSEGLNDDLTKDDIPLSDIEDLDDEEKDDIVPYQRLSINNTSALMQAFKSIALPRSNIPFSEHQVIISAEPTVVTDVHDDLGRELAFYKQSLDAVKEARSLLKTEGIPFSRPVDYFAEMVKSDEHMDKIKHKLTEEAASKKAAADARKQRDLRKFGKQIQVAKLQERDKAKRETLEKIRTLKRSKSCLAWGPTLC
jgi:rRNA-processing protein EBP2